MSSGNAIAQLEERIARLERIILTCYANVGAVHFGLHWPLEDADVREMVEDIQRLA